MNICMIPVRKGSQRLAKKNYLKINGKTIYQIAIEKALSANLFDKIVLKSAPVGAVWFTVFDCCGPCGV